MKRNKKNNNILFVGIAALAALGIYLFTKKDDSGNSGNSDRSGNSARSGSANTNTNTVDESVKKAIDEIQYQKLTDDDIKYWGQSSVFFSSLFGNPEREFERIISYSINDIVKLITSICQSGEISLADFWNLTNDYYLKSYNQTFANALKQELKKRGYDENFNQIKSANTTPKEPVVTTYTDKNGNQIVSTSGRGGSTAYNDMLKKQQNDSTDYYKGRSGSSSSGRR